MSDLVKRDEAQLASEFWGEQFEQADFAIPHVSLGQNTTKSVKGLPGHWNFSNGKRVPELKDVKLIVASKTRVLYGGSGPAVCKSDNYYEPSPFIKNPPSHSCITCPMAQWGENQTKLDVHQANPQMGRLDYNKPICIETYNLLLADENWSPFWIKFQKTQLKVVGEQLFSRIRYDFHGVPPYAVKFDLQIKKIESGEKNYYTTQFANFGKIQDYQRGAELYQSFSKRAITMLAQDHEQMDQQHRKDTASDEVMKTHEGSFERLANDRDYDDIPF